MAITDEVLSELLRDYQKPEDLLGKDGILKQLQKRLLEKALGAEMTVHLGYEKHQRAGREDGNLRNGTSPKTIQGNLGRWRLMCLETVRQALSRRSSARDSGVLWDLTRRSSAYMREG